MVSTFTPNIQLEEPARGDYVGTWDTPVNANMTLLDKTIGAFTTISLNNSPIVLSAAQFQSNMIVFNSTLTANVAVTFPTSFVKPYSIFNNCTGSSAFTITLQTTASGGQSVCPPPGEAVEIMNFGASIYFRNLGRVGSYWDYAGSSVPNWVTGCTVAPYLNCDGSTFSAASFPYLALVLGSTTLPDSRSRVRIATGQSAGRVSSAVSGFAPDTVGAAGGAQSGTIVQANLPAHNHPVSDPGHVHGGALNTGAAYNSPGGATAVAGNATINTGSAVTGLTVSNSTYANSAFAVMQPTYVGGLTLIRAG